MGAGKKLLFLSAPSFLMLPDAAGGEGGGVLFPCSNRSGELRKPGNRDAVFCPKNPEQELVLRAPLSFFPVLYVAYCSVATCVTNVSPETLLPRIVRAEETSFCFVYVYALANSRFCLGI